MVRPPAKCQCSKNRYQPKNPLIPIISFTYLLVSITYYTRYARFICICKLENSIITPTFTCQIHTSSYCKMPSNVIRVEYSKLIFFANSIVKLLPSLNLTIYIKLFVLGYVASRLYIYRSMANNNLHEL